MVRNYGNTTAKQALIDELYDQLCCTEFELDVWEAIGQGTWPSARDYANMILKRCDALSAISPES